MSQHFGPSYFGNRSLFFFYRAPEPQKPHTKPLDDVVHTNHYDLDEDEEYYRKQLSYFDRRSFDSKAMGQPSPGINRFHDLPKPAQLSYPYNRYRDYGLTPLDLRSTHRRVSGITVILCPLQG